LLPVYTTDVHKTRLLYDHSTSLSNFNNFNWAISCTVLLYYGGHDSAFMFFCFIIKGHLLTYLVQMAFQISIISTND